MSHFTEDEYLQLLRNNPAVKIKPVRAEVRDDVNVNAVNDAPPKPAKYRNRKTADGFDSEKERQVYQMLELRQRCGEITELQRQVKYALVVNGIHICDYKADYVYLKGAQRVVVDCKSVITRKLPVYRLKFKLMQACHGIQITEV